MLPLRLGDKDCRTGSLGVAALFLARMQDPCHTTDMKLRVVIEVDIDNGSYEVEMSDDEGRLTENQVPQAVVVVARVMEHVLDGRARRVSPDSPVLSGAPDRGYEN